jgi:hypothetical protein
MPHSSVINWLLESDPAIRWQVKRDLLKESPEAVSTERSKVATEGWGARLLALQAPDGMWGGAVWQSPDWISTMDTLVLLRDLGIDPQSPQARRAIELVLDNNLNWSPEFGNSPFFEGEEEACINGRTLAAGAYFGVNSDKLAQQLISEQMDDGGWNCYTPPSTRSSFHSTICVLEGLLEYENMPGATIDAAAPRKRGEEYLLERHLFRSLSTNEIINPRWLEISFPTRWHYDILRALDYFHHAGAQPDSRLAEAIELVKQKQDSQGRWLLENPHPGRVHFEMEVGGEPSRWNTLRALRVLEWYSTPV